MTNGFLAGLFGLPAHHRKSRLRRLNAGTVTQHAHDDGGREAQWQRG
jgi:hypothetical protein